MIYRFYSVKFYNNDNLYSSQANKFIRTIFCIMKTKHNEATQHDGTLVNTSTNSTAFRANTSKSTGVGNF